MVTVPHDSDDNAPRADGTPITGVAPGAQYDPDIDFSYGDIADMPTVPLRAISPAATVKMPVVCFSECEVARW